MRSCERDSSRIAIEDGFPDAVFCVTLTDIELRN